MNMGLNFEHVHIEKERKKKNINVKNDLIKLFFIDSTLANMCS